MDNRRAGEYDSPSHRLKGHIRVGRRAKVDGQTEWKSTRTTPKGGPWQESFETVMDIAIERGGGQPD